MHLRHLREFFFLQVKKLLFQRFNITEEANSEILHIYTFQDPQRSRHTFTGNKFHSVTGTSYDSDCIDLYRTETMSTLLNKLLLKKLPQTQSIITEPSHLQ